MLPVLAVVPRDHDRLGLLLGIDVNISEQEFALPDLEGNLGVGESVAVHSAGRRLGVRRSRQQAEVPVPGALGSRSVGQAFLVPDPFRPIGQVDCHAHGTRFPEAGSRPSPRRPATRWRSRPLIPPARSRRPPGAPRAWARASPCSRDNAEEWIDPRSTADPPPSCASVGTRCRRR